MSDGPSADDGGVLAGLEGVAAGSRVAGYLVQEQILTGAQKGEIEARVREVVDDAVRYAENSPAPDPSTVADYIFAPDGPIAILGEPGADNPRYVNALDRRTGQPFNVISRAEEAVGRR